MLPFYNIYEILSRTFLMSFLTIFNCYNVKVIIERTQNSIKIKIAEGSYIKVILEPADH
jgi:hypothetical protein